MKGAYGVISITAPEKVAHIEFDYDENRLFLLDDAGELVAWAQPFLVPDHRDTPKPRSWWQRLFS